MRRKRRRVAHDSEDDVLEAGAFHGPAEERKRVHPTRLGVDDAGVVVLPPGLILLGAAMVIHGEQHRSTGPGR